MTEASLAGTSLDDDTLTKLISVFEKLPELSVLDLSETNVTDAGIMQLSVLPRLEKIRARNGSISPEAVAETIKIIEQRQSAGDFAFLGN